MVKRAECVRFVENLGKTKQKAGTLCQSSTCLGKLVVDVANQSSSGIAVQPPKLQTSNKCNPETPCNFTLCHSFVQFAHPPSPRCKPQASFWNHTVTSTALGRLASTPGIARPFSSRSRLPLRPAGGTCLPVKPGSGKAHFEASPPLSVRGRGAGGRGHCQQVSHDHSHIPQEDYN